MQIMQWQCLEMFMLGAENVKQIDKTEMSSEHDIRSVENILRRVLP